MQQGPGHTVLSTYVNAAVCYVLPFLTQYITQAVVNAVLLLGLSGKENHL